MKKFALISCIRTGSNLLYSFIKIMNNEEHNTLSAFFNIFDTKLERTNNGLINMPLETVPVYTEECAKSKKIEWVNILKDYEFSIKSTVYNMHDENIINMLINDGYIIVFLKRADLYDRLLSKIMAEYSNIWRREPNEKLDKSNFDFVCDMIYIDDFFAEQQRYNELRNKFIDCIELSYDTFSHGDFTEVCNILGIQYDKKRADLLKLPSKIYNDVSEKEKYIRNIDEVKEYFNHCMKRRVL